MDKIILIMKKKISLSLEHKNPPFGDWLQAFERIEDFFFEKESRSLLFFFNHGLSSLFTSEE